METLRKQLELKAVEIVDILEALDVDEKVPEVMRRRRGQDNFDQRMYTCIYGIQQIIIRHLTRHY